MTEEEKIKLYEKIRKEAFINAAEFVDKIYEFIKEYNRREGKTSSMYINNKKGL